MTQLVAFTGVAGSGKTTAADFLVRQGWKRVKFAAPLKSMTYALLQEGGVTEPYRYIEGDLKEVPCEMFDGKTPRYVMQTLGTDWARALISENMWINIANNHINMLHQAGFSVVIDDCRFENEVDCVRSLGGKIVEISGRGGIDSNHISEKGVDADFQMFNTRGIGDLEKCIRYVLLETSYE